MKYDTCKFDVIDCSKASFNELKVEQFYYVLVQELGCYFGIMQARDGKRPLKVDRNCIQVFLLEVLL
jgi:hypothetical protein